MFSVANILKIRSSTYKNNQFSAFLENSADLAPLGLNSTWQKEAVSVCIFKQYLAVFHHSAHLSHFAHLYFLSAYPPCPLDYLLLHFFGGKSVGGSDTRAG